LIQVAAGPEEMKNLAGECPPPDSDPFSDAQFAKSLACLSRQFAASADRRFEFKKRSQLFIRSRNEPLSVVAMRGSIQIVRPLEPIAETQPNYASPSLFVLCLGKLWQ